MRRNTERGQSLVEYIALTALVAIVSIGTVKTFGGRVRARLDQVTKTFDRNVQQGLHGRSRSAAYDDDGEDGDDSNSRSVRLPGGLRLPLPGGFGR